MTSATTLRTEQAALELDLAPHGDRRREMRLFRRDAAEPALSETPDALFPPVNAERSTPV